MTADAGGHGPHQTDHPDDCAGCIGATTTAHALFRLNLYGGLPLPPSPTRAERWAAEDAVDDAVAAETAHAAARAEDYGRGYAEPAAEDDD